jgi:hypothetical protein
MAKAKARWVSDNVPVAPINVSAKRTSAEICAVTISLLHFIPALIRGICGKKAKANGQGKGFVDE